MEMQFTRKTGISGYIGNYSIAPFASFTSFTVISGNTRKYGITGNNDIKLPEIMILKCLKYCKEALIISLLYSFYLKPPITIYTPA